MKKHLIYSLCCMYCTPTWCASLLQAQKFQKTYADVSFTDRAEIQHDGYEPYLELSAYDQITLITHEDVAHDAIEQELAESGINDTTPTMVCSVSGTKDNACTLDISDSNASSASQQPSAQQQTSTQQKPSASQQTSQTGRRTQTPTGTTGGYCSKTSPEIPSGQKIPLGNPTHVRDLPSGASSRTKRRSCNDARGLMGAPYICRDNQRGGLRPHTGVDLGLTAEFYRTPIYTTADGRVEKIVTAGDNQSAGNYIRINHGNGWVTQYMHLDEILVNQGDTVSAGCMIGLMGHTGGNVDQKVRSMSRNLTHLHYEIVYSGSATKIKTPDNRTIPIVRGEPGKSCGDFKGKINPSKFISYYYDTSAQNTCNAN